MRSESKSLMMAAIVCATTIASAIVTGDARTTLRFFPDDPRPVDDDARFDASGAKLRELGRYADFVLNTFRSPGDPRPLPAQNVNTLGEVPDSSWFTNRIGQHAMSIAEIVRGPDRTDRLDVRHWVIVEGKSAGRQPGFRAVDAADPTRTLYQIEFDPASNPEMATGAELIGTAIYHTIGYNVVENYLIDLDRSQISIAPTATVSVGGRTRPFTRRDLDRLLRSVAKKANGRYRALASRFADGRYLGPFRYYGTRPDDPNDIIPHEHRRELRGNRVFAAWLNHDDSRGGNSLDMLVGAAEHRFIKHYMFDFGSILGSGTNEEDHPWVGSEYVVEPKPGLLTLVSLGAWPRPFIGIKPQTGLPAAGSFTADRFQPERWKPHYPNQAFRHMQAGDAFWAARIVAGFSPEAVTAIVAKAQFSDARVADSIIGTLLRRRELVMRAWLTPINPVADARVEGDLLRFDNAAEQAGVAEPSSEYDITWFTYDNERGVRTAVTAPRVDAGTVTPLPLAALAGADFAGVEVRTMNTRYPAWQRPVRFYLRHDSNGWVPVGIERSELDEARQERYAHR
jgi:hypothetical protein